MNGRQIGIAFAFVLTLFEFGLPAALIVAALVVVVAYPEQATDLVSNTYRLLTDLRRPALPEPAEEPPTQPANNEVRSLSQDFSVYITETAVTTSADPGVAQPLPPPLPARSRQPSPPSYPLPLPFADFASPPSPLAVPLGTDQQDRQRWLDFGAAALHIGLYGISGCGKDTLLRCWFLKLANNNQVKLAVLDGKGDWLTPSLAALDCWFLPPAGGYGADGTAALLAAIKKIDDEARRRFELIRSADCTTFEQYNQTAPERLPLLVVLISDVVDALEQLDALLIALVSKARALGIRVVVSVQTPTGRDMRWRANLSTTIAGALVDASQDGPALGIRDTSKLPVKPSALPPPPAERGLFVVRHNADVFVVRSPLLDEQMFRQELEKLPKRADEELSALAALTAATGSLKDAAALLAGSNRGKRYNDLLKKGALLCNSEKLYS
ncbi:MAG: hypothetical protein KatS3mg105_5290 [Gemmatales bacterium]|nr:MAG: hypothetical protein KatS3mg105_5290 [Gemmatales bacterium]